MTSLSQPMSRTKKIGFFALLFVLLLLLVELIAFLSLLIIRKGSYSRAGAVSRIEEQAYIQDELEDAKALSRGLLWEGGLEEVIHPYFGYVVDPRASRTGSDYGFLDTSSPIVRRSTGKMNVAIVGGSFAAEVFLLGKTELVAALQPLGKEVVLVNLALGGYKQPQQLLVLTYLQALGAEFDAIINVDGFNEVTLPVCQNLRQHVFPTFPALWAQRVAGVPSRALQRGIAMLEHKREERKKWASFFADYRLCHSAALFILWEGVDASINRDISALKMDISLQQVASDRYVATGPPYSFPSEHSMYDYLATFWMRCSLQIHAMARSHSVRYYHFLQPNLYDAGSKVLTADERAFTSNDRFQYGPGVINGYPLLRKYGEVLKQEGVFFHDLTMTFAHDTNTVYRDNCCHLLSEGYERIARLIGEAMVRDWGDQ